MKDGTFLTPLHRYWQQWKQRRALKLRDEHRLRGGLDDPSKALDFLAPRLDFEILDETPLTRRQDQVLTVEATITVYELSKALRDGLQAIYTQKELSIEPLGEFPRYINLDDYLLYEGRPVRLGAMCQNLISPTVVLLTELESLESEEHPQAGYYRRRLTRYFKDVIGLLDAAYSLQYSEASAHEQ
jgi:hypothetical protein